MTVDILDGNSRVEVPRDQVPPNQSQVGHGIVRGFVIGTGSGLSPAITQGLVVGPRGQAILNKITGNDNLFPNLPASSTRYAYWNHITGKVDYNTTNAPTQEGDVSLGKIVTSSSAITEITLGQWINAETLHLMDRVDIKNVTGNMTPYDFWGNPKYILGSTVVPVVDLVGTDAVLKLHHVSHDGSDVEIATHTLAAVTAAVGDVVGAPNSRQIITPRVIRPGDRLYWEVETGIGTSGNVDALVHLGGLVQ